MLLCGGENNPDFSELAGLSVNLDRPGIRLTHLERRG